MSLCCYASGLFASIVLLSAICGRCSGQNTSQIEEEFCTGKNYFKCEEGHQCIQRTQLCDGIVDCHDSSDESILCRDYIKSCPLYAFHCSYGACISGSSKCDGVQDCADNSDENSAACQNDTVETTNVPITVCGLNQFICTSGQCIEQVAVCDGTPHCTDGSDETRMVCSNNTCPSASYQCEYGACVHKQARCNGIVDCADRSDEDPNLCRKAIATTTTRTVWTTFVCLLPNPPKNGRYSIRTYEKLRAGQFVEDGTYISYSCNSDHELRPNVQHFVCMRGQWSPSNHPRCVAIRRKPWWYFL